MLAFTDVTLHRGPAPVLEKVSFAVHPGQKVGVVGANGAGKTSLLLLARGVLAPESGDVRHPDDWVVAHLAQETPSLERAAIEHVIDGDTELREIEAGLVTAQAAGDGRREAALHGRVESIQGYAAPARAARLLAGLGFAPADETRPVSEFSGGWRMRLNLARALMCRSDLLLLDEPTNHLDLDAIVWLEEWLRAYPGTLLLVTHDRDFLDPVAGHILHVEQRAARLYTGNYSSFEKQRSADLARRAALHARQQREVAHMRGFVERFRAKASKARQAQSRLKALARMELIAPAHVDSPFGFGFAEPDALPRPLLTVDKAAAGYGEREVLAGVSLALEPGDRVALLGRNGAGKSTLVRLLAGTLEPRTGRVERAPRLEIGYFAQHLVEQLDPASSPLAHLRRLEPETREQALRDHLGGFGFHGDAALAPVAPLSGGEKARLALALIVRARPNLLLLDEPTNHLDLEMRHALSVALQEFSGAIVLVAHDRHLLRLVADRLVLVADATVREFDGDLDDYARWLRSEGALPADAGAGVDLAAPSGRERRHAAAVERARLRPLRARTRELEARLERLQAERAALAGRLADTGLYDPARKEELRPLLVEQGRIEAGIAEAEAAWIDATGALEAAEASAGT